jgi:hypothetical protein
MFKQFPHQDQHLRSLSTDCPVSFFIQVDLCEKKANHFLLFCYLWFTFHFFTVVKSNQCNVLSRLSSRASLSHRTPRLLTILDFGVQDLSSGCDYLFKQIYKSSLQNSFVSFMFDFWIKWGRKEGKIRISHASQQERRKQMLKSEKNFRNGGSPSPGNRHMVQAESNATNVKGHVTKEYVCVCVCVCVWRHTIDKCGDHTQTTDKQRDNLVACLSSHPHNLILTLHTDL